MKLAIVVGSTREGRQTLKQAKWVLNTAKENEDIETELVDLTDYPMPFFDEPVSPRYNPDRQIDLRAQKWLKKIESFDAYIFVTPEYNHSITGVLKNALDYITWELVHKPAAVVSHGSAGGARAQVHLKEILSESRAAIIPTAPSVAVVHMSELIDDNGKLTDAGKANPYLQTAMDDLIEDIKWYGDALAIARVPRRELEAVSR